MYCKNCGKEIEEGKEYCVDCEPKAEAVGEETPAQETKTENTTTTTSAELKSKMAAGLLGIFLGQFGVHNFYLGYTKKAIIQVCVSAGGWLLSVCTLGITCLAPAAMGVWGLVEGIQILTGSINKDGKGNPLKD